MGPSMVRDNNNRRQEVLRQLREKLKKCHERSTIGKSTKAGMGAKPVDGTAVVVTNAKAGGGGNALSMSTIESHIQNYTVRFVDLIIGCMVVDNYSKLGAGDLMMGVGVAAITFSTLMMDHLGHCK